MNCGELNGEIQCSIVRNRSFSVTVNLGSFGGSLNFATTLLPSALPKASGETKPLFNKEALLPSSYVNYF